MGSYVRTGGVEKKSLEIHNILKRGRMTSFLVINAYILPYMFSAYKLHVVEEKVYYDEGYNVFFLSLQGLYVS